MTAAAREGRNEHSLLVSGLGDRGGGQRVFKTLKSSKNVLDFGVGRWRPQAKGSQNSETSTNSRFGGGGRKRAGRTLKTSSRACFQVGRMVVVAKECRNPENEHVLLVFGVGGWWVNQ